MTAVVEIRAEPPDGAATRALFAEYLVLLQDRLGLRFKPSERIFATEAAFAGPDGAWLVLYDCGRPVGCGGLRTLAPGVGEIKRMFVTQSARRSGHGRLLLHELERLAVRRGHTCVRLLTTEVLSEARKLYAAEGYRVIERMVRGSDPVEIWLEKDVP
ncbi:MAG: GNAT family N-acetyltransferase [Solirubrobacteraceae bacterium]